MERLFRFLTNKSAPASGDRDRTQKSCATRSSSRRSLNRECGTHHREGLAETIGWSATFAHSKTPESFSRKGRRRIPSECRTAACAARHDHTVEVVWSSAQSTI